MDFKETYDLYKNEIITHVKNLVRINSVLIENEIVDGVCYPFGIGNKKALEYVLNLGAKMGFKTKNVKDVCGHIEYGEGDDIFAVLCHVDVVPAEGDWSNPPFEPIVLDNKIYGRGTSDDKGPAISSLYALFTLKELGIKLNKRVRLIFGTDEESGSRGLIEYLKIEKMPTLGISPDADFPLIYGEKGMCTIDIISQNNSKVKAIGGVRYNVVAPKLEFTGLYGYDNEFLKLGNTEIQDNTYIVYGKSAHAMEPNNGVNAIKRFVTFIHDKINDSFIDFIYDNLQNTRLKDMKLDITDDEMGDLTMNMGMLEMDKENRLGINIRFPRNLDFDKFIKDFGEICERYGLKMELKSYSNPHYVDPKSDFIKTLYSSYTKYTNDFSPMKTIGGGTYARALKKAVAFGILFPGEREMAHEVDEFVSIDSLLKAKVIITDAIYNICK